MSRISLKPLLSVGLAVLACLPVGSITHAEPIQWVTVGDPGNTANTGGRGLGSVATSFRLMTFEFTNQQYTDFLNSVAATDTYSLYNTNMESDSRGGISRSGSPGSYSYAVLPNMGDKPVNYVSWYDAARVSNWLMNGATSSSSTETGAYTLVGGVNVVGPPAVNPGATFYLPTETQWYKAAYYKGGGTNAGYWDYATQSNTAPTAVTAGATGIGSAGNIGNFANWDGAASWNNSQDGNVTTVGTNGKPSAYGAFDMNGNVVEWNDLVGEVTGSNRGVRGGAWISNTAFSLSSDDTYQAELAWGEGYAIGFRLASPLSSSVPEIDPSCFGSALALVIGSLGLLERRRAR